MKNETMSKHTPGPWVLEDKGYKYIVHKPGDGYITRDVCRIDSSTMSAFNQEANARLIAAAPELLEFVCEWLDRQGSDENYMTAKAKAIISKVTGETK